VQTPTAFILSDIFSELVIDMRTIFRIRFGLHVRLSIKALSDFKSLQSKWILDNSHEQESYKRFFRSAKIDKFL